MTQQDTVSSASSRSGSQSSVPLDQLLDKARREFEGGLTDQSLQTLNVAAGQYPDEPSLFCLMGQVLDAAGQIELACQAYQLAHELEPGSPEYLFYLGRESEKAGDLESAITAYHQAIELDRGFVEALSNLGSICVRIEQLDAAEQYYLRALKMAPQSPEILNGLGNLMRYRHRSREAREYYRRACASNPDDAVVLTNLAAVSNAEEAELLLTKALKLNGDLAEANYSLALLQLAKGNLREGWQHYEWRFSKEEEPVSRRVTGVPEWHGSSIPSGTLLLWGEQGVGDEIMFACAIDDALKHADETFIEVDPRLVKLLGRSFPTAKVAAHGALSAGMVGQVSAHSAFGSLMRLFRNEMASFGQQRYPYLIPDAGRVQYWKDWLATTGPGYKIGFSWRSGLMRVLRSVNYPDIDDCADLLARPGVQWINIQYGDCERELLDAETRFGVTIHRPPLDLKNDLDDLAALLLALDLVLTAATATAQLAGAVGAHALCFGPNRPWTLLGQKTLPWYRNMAYVARTETGKSWREMLDVPALLYVSGDRPGAFSMIEMAYESDGRRQDEYARLAELEIRKGAKPDAVALMERDFEKGRLSVPNTLRLVRFLFEGNELDQVVRHVRDVYCRDATQMDVLSALGWSRFMQGDIGGAGRLMSEDHACDRMSPVWMSRFGAVLAAGGDIDRGEAIVSEAYGRDATLRDGYALVGWLSLFFHDRPDVANELLDRDESLGRVGEQAGTLKAFTLGLQGRTQEAVEAIERAYAENLKIRDGYAGLGWLLVRVGNVAQGLALMAVDAASERMTFPWRATYAYYLASNGAYDQARVQLAMVMNKAPAQTEFTIGPPMRPDVRIGRDALEAFVSGAGLS